MSQSCLLKAKNLSQEFSGTTIFKEVNLYLAEGELICLLGVSGAGKTTLFNVLSGLQMPKSGHIFLREKEITGEAGHLAYMLQKDLLLPYRTVLDNAALPLLIRGETKAQAREKAAAFFPEFGISGTENKWPSQLSGGMRQRVALLRTYLSNDGAALLDEPFSALDTITKSAIHHWYLNVMEKIKLSTLFITHDINEAILLSDRIYILSGTPSTITAEIKIAEPRPRSSDFPLTSTFLDYKKQILSLLRLNGAS